MRRPLLFLLFLFLGGGWRGAYEISRSKVNVPRSLRSRTCAQGWSTDAGMRSMMQGLKSTDDSEICEQARSRCRRRGLITSDSGQCYQHTDRAEQIGCGLDKRISGCDLTLSIARCVLSWASPHSSRFTFTVPTLLGPRCNRVTGS